MLPKGAKTHLMHVNRDAAAEKTPHAHLWLAIYCDGATAGIWAIPNLDGSGYEIRRFSSMPWSHWPTYDYRAEALKAA